MNKKKEMKKLLLLPTKYLKMKPMLKKNLKMREKRKKH